MKSVAAASFVALAVACWGVQVSGQDCNAVLSQLMETPECMALQSQVMNAGPQAAAAGGCGGVRAVSAAFFTYRGVAGDIPASCCPALRNLITSGCVCDDDFKVAIQGIVGLASAEAATATMDGAAAMTQSGTCARPENGGAIINPCTGGLGPCGGIPSA